MGTILPALLQLRKICISSINSIGNALAPMHSLKDTEIANQDIKAGKQVSLYQQCFSSFKMKKDIGECASVKPIYKQSQSTLKNLLAKSNNSCSGTIGHCYQNSMKLQVRPSPSFFSCNKSTILISLWKLSFVN